MNLLGIGTIAKDIIGGLGDLFTSDDERLQAEIELMKVLQQPAMLQALTNIQEAKHSSVFVAGWRPALGWVCALGLGYGVIARDIIIVIAALFEVDLSELPPIDTATLISLTLALLGLSTQRTVEKLRGVQRESLE